MKTINYDEFVEFMKWSLTPVFTPFGYISPQARVCWQAPDYQTCSITDEFGKNILPENKYLTIEELFDFWQKNGGIRKFEVRYENGEVIQRSNYNSSSRLHFLNSKLENLKIVEIIDEVEIFAYVVKIVE